MIFNGPFLEFALGAALIALPQFKLPLVAATGALHIHKALRRRRDQKQDALVLPGDADPSQARGAVTLEWDQLDCFIVKKDASEKQILHSVAGVARPGRLLALMGASGSGKTTLLTALAGQLPASPGMQLRGVIRVNGRPYTRSRHRQGFVAQEDVFYSQLTVRETLTMAAKLRMPQSATPSEREAVVAGLIKRLGLAKVADTIVGDKKTRGLSGGEKKRLGIGCELISSPQLLFADEPTTGLDAFQAERVMQTLKELAQEGCTVIASIHQPRSSIFLLFDDLMLMSEGSLVYGGPASGVLDFFGARGFSCPDHFNPAEFLVDTIAIDHTSPDTEAKSKDRVDKLVRAYKQGAKEDQGGGAQGARGDQGDQGPSTAGAVVPVEPRSGSNWRQQLSLLFVRSWRQVTRDKATTIARAMSSISSAIIFGSIFWRMGHSQSSIQDRLGLLQVSAINAAMASLVKTLNVFPKERVIVERERARASYDVLPYFVSKLAAESPIGALFPLLFGAVVYPACGLNPRLDRFAKFLGVLTLESFTSTALGLAVGAAAPNTDAAVAIGPAVMVVFIVFGGYYVNPENVPVVFRWIPRASLIKHGFEGLALAEFPGLTFDRDPKGEAGDMTGGEQVLHRLGFDQSSVPKTLKAQTRLLLFNYWATYCILKARRPKFVPLEAPLPKDVPQAAAPMAPPPSAAPKLPEKPALSKQQARRRPLRNLMALELSKMKPQLAKQPGLLVSREEPGSDGVLLGEFGTVKAKERAGVP